jgi:hypothetical protein
MPRIVVVDDDDDDGDGAGSGDDYDGVVCRCPDEAVWHYGPEAGARVMRG